MNKLKFLPGNMSEADFIDAGFNRVESKYLTIKAPKIDWGRVYKSWDTEHKMQYLEKLATSMNHAASLIQDERNQLNVLLENKEKQLEEMNKAMKQNSDLLVSEIVKMNAQRQAFRDTIAGLDVEIRKLRNGNHN